MNNKPLGRFEKVDLREIWSSESSDFTPWLAEEDNLKLLGDTIGIDLELEAQEKDVGPFRADILCKDTGTGSWVLVENQLEKTDHTHLGQLLTYAAGLSAVTIVWVSQRFTDEHRATLDWLNNITSGEINFFGLEVELWKISESPVAPKFNIVSKPNDWVKSGSGVSRQFNTGKLTATKSMYLDFWTQMRERVLERGSFLKSYKPLPQYWTHFSIGRSGFLITCVISVQKKFINCGIELVGPDAKAHFHLLRENESDIERDFGQKLTWRELPERERSYIQMIKNLSNPSDKEKWPEMYDWIIDNSEKFHKLFANRIKNLDANEYENSE